MKRKRSRDLQFSVLDALRTVSLPESHRISSIAAFLIDNGKGLPNCLEDAFAIAELLAGDPCEARPLAERIISAMQDQVRIKAGRIHRRITARELCRMGSQLDRQTRTNRICASVFGDGKTWRPARQVLSGVSAPYFNWLHRSAGNTRVAGFDGLQDTNLVTGFVYKGRSSIHFGLLPARARSIEELYSFLGLHPKLHRSPNVEIDWGRRAFMVSGDNRLPWILP